MSRLSDTLDLLSERGNAAFAIDSADYIVYWNSACEKLLGHPAGDVLGKRCHDVIAGRDMNGNMYCFRNCPVAYQAREDEEKSVNEFPLVIRDSSGADRHIIVSLFSIPAARASLSSVVHVLREGENAPITQLERELEENAKAARAPRWPMTSSAEKAEPELTARQREILRCMAKGLGTAPEQFKQVGRRYDSHQSIVFDDRKTTDRISTKRVTSMTRIVSPLSRKSSQRTSDTAHCSPPFDSRRCRSTIIES